MIILFFFFFHFSNKKKSHKSQLFKEVNVELVFFFFLQKMYKQKFLYLIFISLFEFNYGLVSEWGRCDEKERFCASGLECVYFDPEYSQCQKSKSSTSSNCNK